MNNVQKIIKEGLDKVYNSITPEELDVLKKLEHYKDFDTIDIKRKHFNNLAALHVFSKFIMNNYKFNNIIDKGGVLKLFYMPGRQQIDVYNLYKENNFKELEKLVRKYLIVNE